MCSDRIRVADHGEVLFARVERKKRQANRLHALIMGHRTYYGHPVPAALQRLLSAEKRVYISQRADRDDDNVRVRLWYSSGR